MFKVPLFLYQLYPVNYVLNNLLNELLDAGVELVDESGQYEIIIKFKNGVQTTMWNRNRWYAWCSDGDIGGYKWHNQRPTRKVLRRLYRAIYVDYKPVIKGVE